MNTFFRFKFNSSKIDAWRYELHSLYFNYLVNNILEYL